MDSIRLYSQAQEMRTPLDSPLLENDSMGSGSIMRSAWIGLHPNLPDEGVSYLSKLQFHSIPRIHLFHTLIMRFPIDC